MEDGEGGVDEEGRGVGLGWGEEGGAMVGKVGATADPSTTAEGISSGVLVAAGSGVGVGPQEMTNARMMMAMGITFLMSIAPPVIISAKAQANRRFSGEPQVRPPPQGFGSWLELQQIPAPIAPD
jgi:hypothetical protein